MWLFAVDVPLSILCARDYINMTWSCGYLFASLLVLVNFVAQIAGCVMVLIRKKVPIAVGILFGVIVLQVLFCM